eukprot:gnl/MRDRNA2_/MRDRNA2_76057_c0_seq2.p1 gnl/MRDRNA2_/MRDRNA2_76057_c0~~gnl/MRDRNA2_/MRDRNA2_76057_c0_seq2.p1  ORF type:complete len:292 (+),score=59.12 gnl/MRDRNA2_/MRDRNA2_76057_c0_seq2:112-987(+)
MRDVVYAFVADSFPHVFAIVFSFVVVFLLYKASQQQACICLVGDNNAGKTSIALVLQDNVLKADDRLKGGNIGQVFPFEEFTYRCKGKMSTGHHSEQYLPVTARLVDVISLSVIKGLFSEQYALPTEKKEMLRMARRKNLAAADGFVVVVDSQNESSIKEHACTELEDVLKHNNGQPILILGHKADSIIMDRKDLAERLGLCPMLGGGGIAPFAVAPFDLGLDADAVAVERQMQLRMTSILPTANKEYKQNLVDGMTWVARESIKCKWKRRLAYFTHMGHDMAIFAKSKVS